MSAPEQESYSKAIHNVPFFMREFLNFNPRDDQTPVLDAIKQGAKRILLCKGRRWGGRGSGRDGS